MIATKVGYDIYDEAALEARRGQSELPMRTDPAFMRFAVDKCLERLETDYIDVLQIHNAKMEHVRDRGAVGHAARTAARRKDPRVGRRVRSGDRLVVRGRRARRARAGHQHHPDDLERARAASGHGDDRGGAAHAPNCCFNIRVTHASGMLEGKYTADTVFPENDHRRHRPRIVAGERRARR